MKIDAKRIARTTSNHHDRVGSSLVDMETCQPPTTRFYLLGLSQQVETGRALPPIRVRRFLWMTRNTKFAGRPILASWYNEGDGTSLLVLGVGTNRKKVAEQLRDSNPDLTLVDTEDGK